MRKTTSAVDRLEKALAAEGIKLPRHRLKHIAATVAGCRNDNEYVHRSEDLYPPVAYNDVVNYYGTPLHILRDPRTNRTYAVDSAMLEKGQDRAALLAPCPYGGMVDMEEAMTAYAKSVPVGGPYGDTDLPLFRFTITREATESASVEIHAEDIEEARDIALSRSFWEDPTKVCFELDDNYASAFPYLPDPDDYEKIIPGEE